MQFRMRNGENINENNTNRKLNYSMFPNGSNKKIFRQQGIVSSNPFFDRRILHNRFNESFINKRMIPNQCYDFFPGRIVNKETIRNLNERTKPTTVNSLDLRNEVDLLLNFSRSISVEKRIKVRSNSTLNVDSYDARNEFFDSDDFTRFTNSKNLNTFHISDVDQSVCDPNLKDDIAYKRFDLPNDGLSDIKSKLLNENKEVDNFNEYPDQNKNTSTRVFRRKSSIISPDMIVSRKNSELKAIQIPHRENNIIKNTKPEEAISAIPKPKKSKLIEMFNWIQKYDPIYKANSMAKKYLAFLIKNIDVYTNRRKRSKQENLSSEDKKNNHVESEHHRRDAINLGLYALSEIIPGPVSKSKKSVILNAIHYIMKSRYENSYFSKKSL
ncbi:hypothetical protein CWI37_0148p0060 [Hamiltosporidium tvaerminnensis]|uniref:BHLH domain-containing protein n=1 Tax=Hamiltosporidium tvaerminnensis TaxID=1176355 RepID=A0A4Q9L9H3_9MICR|nr:hypothetical protein CWI37_0148p0060 [Hamiltosporidium tvaerminnensis]